MWLACRSILRRRPRVNAIHSLRLPTSCTYVAVEYRIGTLPFPRPGALSTTLRIVLDITCHDTLCTIPRPSRSRHDRFASSARAALQGSHIAVLPSQQLSVITFYAVVAFDAFSRWEKKTTADPCRLQTPAWAPTARRWHGHKLTKGAPSNKPSTEPAAGNR